MDVDLSPDVDLSLSYIYWLLSLFVWFFYNTLHTSPINYILTKHFSSGQFTAFNDITEILLKVAFNTITITIINFNVGKFCSLHGKRGIPCDVVILGKLPFRKF